MLGLCFCARAFSSCGKRGRSSSRCTGLSLSRPLLLRSTGSSRAGSVVVAHGPSCSAAYGILPDQGANLRPLHWQADSQPLCHQGSPIMSSSSSKAFTSCPLPTEQNPCDVWHLKSLIICGWLFVQSSLPPTVLWAPWVSEPCMSDSLYSLPHS